MKTMLERATERTYAILDVLDEYGFNVDEPYRCNLPNGYYIEDGACRVVVIDSNHCDFVIKSQLVHNIAYLIHTEVMFTIFPMFELLR